MPWKVCNPMDERLKFVARRLDGEKMAGLCREFGISRKRIRTSDLCLRRQKLALLCAARPSVAGISEAGPGRVDAARPRGRPRRPLCGGVTSIFSGAGQALG